MRKQRSLSPQRLTSRFVDAQEPLNIGVMIEQAGAGWADLCAAIQRVEYPSLPTLDQRVDSTEQISAALPDDAARMQFVRLLDAYTGLETVSTDAAFLVGLEVGRRLKGAA